MPPRPDFNDIVDILEARGVLRTVLDGIITLPIASTDPHLTLCHVSQKLRGIIISNSSYWKTFILSSRTFQSRQHFLDCLSTFSGRRGSQQISFAIVTDPDAYARMALSNISIMDMVYGSGRIGLFTEILRPHLGHLRFVLCYVSRVESSSFLRIIPHGAFQVQEAGDGDFLTDPSRSYPNSAIQRSYSSTPSNTPPGFNGPFFRVLFTGDVHPLDVTFQWSNMTRFDFRTRPMSPEDVMRIMERSSYSLWEAYFDVQFDTRSTQMGLRHRMHKPLISMIVLTNLHFQLIDGTRYLDFIHLFHLPVLRDLSIVQTTVNSSFTWDMASYALWLSPASYSLKTLSLSYNPSDPEPKDVGYPFQSRRTTSSAELEALLRTTLRLTSLRLPANIYLQSPILTKISDADLLPSVETLEFSTDADPTEVFHIVSNRRRTVDPSSSARPAQILSLDIRVLATYLPVQEQLIAQAESLNLEGGCILQFVL